MPQSKSRNGTGLQQVTGYAEKQACQRANLLSSLFVQPEKCAQ